MISHQQMAKMVAARLQKLEVVVANLQAKLVLERAKARRLAAPPAIEKPKEYRVEGVDFGDGKPVVCLVRVGPDFITVRQRKSPRSWTLPLASAAGLVAIRAQVLEVRAKRGF